MSKYDVSVIVPVYNTEKYLEECLDSVLLQRGVNIEIICINDGSPDDSLKILENYSKDNENFSYIDQANTGGATAINSGLAVAKGDYVMILDSDDFLPKGTLLTMMNMAKKNSSDIVIGKVTRFDLKNSEDSYDTEWIISNSNRLSEDEYDCLYQSGIYNGKLISRNFLETHRIKFIDGLLYADRPFMYLCYYHCETVSVVNRVTHCWRQRVNKENLSITDRKNELKTLSDRIKSMEVTRSFLRSEEDAIKAKKHALFAELDNARRPLWHLKFLNVCDLVRFYDITQEYYSEVDRKSYAGYSLQQRVIVLSLRKKWLFRFIIFAGVYTLAAKVELFATNSCTLIFKK